VETDFLLCKKTLKTLQRNICRGVLQLILQGDAKDRLKEIETGTVDLILTDPPYGYSFMGKDWDKAVPDIAIWKECLRVLKDGAFCLVMSAPRQDVLSRMMINLENAGFDTNYTSIYWTYASGFPKAGNIGKMVDKRLGVEREVIGISEEGSAPLPKSGHAGGFSKEERSQNFNLYGGPVSLQAKALDGSYAGFQPKPAVEVVIVCMKPITEKTYVDQAMKNGKGITWLDDCRIPYEDEGDKWKTDSMHDITSGNLVGSKKTIRGISQESNSQGRFPANLLVSDDVLKDGENGSYSRYFDLDAWNAQFLIVPKASKGEKNRGLYGLPKVYSPNTEDNPNPKRDIRPNNLTANHHPTVKPTQLFRYLITMFSRKDDLVLDPFVGSGTTCVAAKELERGYMGIDSNPEYVKIAEARLEAIKTQLDLFRVEGNL